MYQLQPKGGFTEMEIKIIEQVRNHSIDKIIRQGDNLNKTEIQMIKENVIPGCLHFIQDEFGSAYCISNKGHILTCAHCVVPENGNKKQKLIQNLEQKYLIFANGQIVKAKVLKYDEKLDCALMQIINSEIQEKRENFNNININNNNYKTSENEKENENENIYSLKQKNFPFLKISKQNGLEKQGNKIFCIGQPGYVDLETEISDNQENFKETNFTPFYVSKGKIKGYLKDYINVSKEEELGPLKHNCWTYWGHSGAPIVNFLGEVVGMHNSWDDCSGMRHGMSLASIQKFLQECDMFME